MSEINLLLQNAADRIRINSIKATNASNSGHPTSCSSMAEIMSVLFLDVMKYNVHDPRNPNNDRFILSKGHAAPGLYAAWVEAGLLKPEDLLNLRKFHSDLEGHPTPRLPFIDVATGSLGQGLSCAAGMAYTGKYLEPADYRVFCVVGDGESAEGSVWEALAFGSYYKLDNLVAVFDINRLGQSQATALGHDMDVYCARLAAFGWHVVSVNGQDVAALRAAFSGAADIKGKPTAVVAKTFKGAGLIGIENMDNWHGKPLGAKSADVIAALEAKIMKSGLAAAGDTSAPAIKAPSSVLSAVPMQSVKLSSPPAYKKGDMVATRAAYGIALVKLGESSQRVVALDGDVKNSTFSIKFKERFPDRFVECFIAEQNLVGVAIGCGTRNRTIPFVSTFAAFLSRAFDQIRMGAISQTNCNFVGSHAGVSIGEDGPSQMALEDLAMFRAVAGSTVLYPSDAVSCERAVELVANTPGICFIRTGRPNAPILYDAAESFAVGKAKVLVSAGPHVDKVTVVGAGVTLHAAMTAANTLRQKHNTEVRVVDLFSVKPVDAELLRRCVLETGGRLVTVEDHYLEGGIGEAVLAAVADYGIPLKVTRLGVTSVPRSGTPDQLLAMYGIDEAGIVSAVQGLLA